MYESSLSQAEASIPTTFLWAGNNKRLLHNHKRHGQACKIILA